MMYSKILLMIHVNWVMSAPMQLLMPLQNQQLQSQELLQQQMMAMQQMQVLQRFNAAPWPSLMPQQPLIVLLDTNTIMDNKEINQDHTTKRPQLMKSDKNSFEDLDSVVIDAATEEKNRIDLSNLPLTRTNVLIPYQGKYIIGQIISAIPFLPFEVNVPDTISWIYNGISGIISGIGQTFRPNAQTAGSSTSTAQTEAVTKWFNLLRKQQSKNVPLAVVPIANLYMLPLGR